MFENSPQCGVLKFHFPWRTLAGELYSPESGDMAANYPGTCIRKEKVVHRKNGGVEMMSHYSVVAELRGVTEIHDSSLSVVSVYR